MLANRVCSGNARRGRGAVPNRLHLMAWLPLAVALVSTLEPVAVNAQSREVLIGTVTSRPNPTSRDQDRGRAAADLLAEGIAALDRGDVMVGRRRLEVLVERYPDTLAASAARDQLGAIYSTAKPRAPREPVAASEGGNARLVPVQQAIEARPSEVVLRTTAAEEALPPRSKVGRDDRRQQALGAEFQDAVGDRVFFAETSAELGARARTVLAAQARWLAAHADAPVVIEAHADDHQGNRELDVRLAQRRGQLVRERLIEEGVAPDRIVVQAFGRDRPVAACSSPECAAQNRRVVTRIGGTQDGIDHARRGFDSPALATGPSRSPPRRGD